MISLLVTWDGQWIRYRGISDDAAAIWFSPLDRDPRLADRLFAEADDEILLYGHRVFHQQDEGSWP